MIGVHMRLDNPVERQPTPRDLCDHGIGVIIGDAARCIVKIQDAVDD